jgi:nucleotide-binding universal stress UspA family protein
MLEQPPVARVLIAVDDPVDSTHTAVAAIRCFGSDATYLAVHVEDSVPVIGWPRSCDSEQPGTYPTTRITRDDAAQRASDGMQHVCPHVHPIGALGDPVDEIRRVAAAHHADVIVVGWRHHSWWSKLVGDSVVDELLRTSTVPVFVVPQADPDGETGLRHGSGVRREIATSDPRATPTAAGTSLT